MDQQEHGGPISPDGRHQWNGSEWVPIPPPPKPKMDAHNYFQVFCLALLVVLVLAILMAALGGFGD